MKNPFSTSAVTVSLITLYMYLPRTNVSVFTLAAADAWLITAMLLPDLPTGSINMRNTKYAQIFAFLVPICVKLMLLDVQKNDIPAVPEHIIVLDAKEFVPSHKITT